MTNWKLLISFLFLNIICAAISVSCKSTTQEASNLPEIPYAGDLQSAIDQVLSEYPEYELGISAAVITPGYAAWTGVSGVSQPGVPLTSEMLFIAGSILKNFEAALVLKLVEEGRLSLDDPVSMHLPPYRNVDSETTLRQLLNHSSGIFNVFEHPDFPWLGPDVDYAKEWTEEEVFNTFVLEPYGPPGYAQHYSSTNYLLVTSIIEKVTGSTVPDELERYFLKPMKLKNTYVTMNVPPPARYPVAHPWMDVDGDGALDDLHGIPQTWSASLTHPTMYATPEDLARWMHALYVEGSVLSPDSLEEMLTYPETTLQDPEGGMYGLGVVDYSKVLGMEALGHGGSALGYSAAALYLPEYHITVVWMINTGQSPEALGSNIMGDTWSALSKVIKNNQ